MKHKIIYSDNPKNWREVTENCIIAEGENRLIIVYNGMRRTPAIAAAYFWQSAMCTYIPDKHNPTDNDDAIIEDALALPQVKVQPTAILYTEDEYKTMPECERWKIIFYEDSKGIVHNAREIRDQFR